MPGPSGSDQCTIGPTPGGFAPVARFTLERNKSTIELYDFSRTRSEIGLVRAF